MEHIFNYYIIIRGRVQGVGYRAFASKMAIALGLKGYVKNKLDGSVQIEVEGIKKTLDEFVTYCERGPGWGYVENLDVKEYPTQGYCDFKIKY